ncbi:MAG TPA: 16S rRNA (guanine(966)-N(2))-methyltransferase RsmD [Acidimicrobiia bacterium]|jgi:16S rRNA (guanine966-N2)-methyltransferase
MNSRRHPRATQPRIIAGTARGRRLEVPPAGVRPTKDRVKAAVFSALDARGLLDGAVVLDLYAGCGALGLESLSRGAAHGTFVERDPAALQALRDNVSALGWRDRAVVRAGAAERVVAERGPQAGSFDLAFVDPPYEMADARVAEVLARLVERLPDGTIVVERPSHGSGPLPAPPGWSVMWERTFGDTLVAFVQPQTDPF